MKKCLLLLLTCLLTCCANENGFDLQKTIGHRPDSDGMIYDYAGRMADVKESTRRHLANIRDRFQIEILIAALPSLGGKYTVNQAATAIFSNWNIGKGYQNLGILILLVDDIKAVKLEVAPELEDVFTDLLTDHIEKRQLTPHHGAEALEIELIAVLEQLEARAQVKFKSDYTRAEIARMDATYLAERAAARRAPYLTPRPAQFSGSINSRYPAGETAQQAWQTMVQSWQDKTRDPYLGVFTPLTRLTYRDYTNLPDSHFEKEYRTYAQKGYKILVDGNYAVVYFGRKKGWHNAPFLLCRTPEGWQFDIVHQRRFIRMGPAPQWGVEFSEHPHMGLLMETFQYKGQDIPFDNEDLYTIAKDAAWANQILEYESIYQADATDFETLVALGRLYTLASMSRKGIKLLNTAIRQSPDDPRPYKYLAISHVNAHYQYDSALKALDHYIERGPRDRFSYNFKGYILYRKKAYAKAANAFEKALALSPDNCYAHFYLAYTYAWLYDQALKSNPRRNTYKERFNLHATQTRSYQKRHPLRIAVLNRWLAKK